MEKRPRGKSVAVSRWNRKIDSKRMVAVRGLFVDRNWNRKFSNTRYDFDLYGGIANRSPCAKHGVPDARHGLSLRTKYSVACAYTEYILSRVPCIICYWWIISPSVFHECLSNETRYVCFRVRRALRNIPRFFAKTPRLPFFKIIIVSKLFLDLLLIDRSLSKLDLSRIEILIDILRVRLCLHVTICFLFYYVRRNSDNRDSWKFFPCLGATRK